MPAAPAGTVASQAAVFILPMAIGRTTEVPLTNNDGTVMRIPPMKRWSIIRRAGQKSLTIEGRQAEVSPTAEKAVISNTLVPKAWANIKCFVIILIIIQL